MGARMRLNKSNTKKIMFLITFTVLLLVGVWRLDVLINTAFWIINILQPFIVGGCIAFILGLPMKMFEQILFRKGKTKNKILKGLSRPISILLSIVFVVGIIFFVFFIIVPEVGNTIALLVHNIPDYVDNISKLVTKLLNDYPQIQEYISGVAFDWQKVSDSLLNVSSSLADGFFSSASSILSGIVSTITTFIIGFVFAIYLLAYKEKLSVQIKKLLYGYLPRKRAERILKVASLANKTFASYVSGQCVEAVILGTMFFITLSILRFPYPLLIGVLVAFTALIPILGAYIGSVISAFLILMVNPIQALWFIVILLVLQQIEGNFIYPHVVGGSVGLPSLWVLFAVTVGGSLMGIVGMIIFIPILSVIYTLLRENVNLRLMIRRIPEEKWKQID